MFFSHFRKFFTYACACVFFGATFLLADKVIPRPHPLPFKKSPPFRLQENFVPAALSADGADELKRCSAVLDHLKHHRWVAAYESANQKCLILAKLSLWHSLYHGGSPQLLDAYIMFMAEQSWPRHSNLSINLEKLASHVKQDQKLVNWFQQHPPKTADGKIAFAKALNPQIDGKKRQKIIGDLWRNMSLSEKQFADVYRTFKNAMTPAIHKERLQSMLWKNSASDLKPLEPFLDTADRKIASFCRHAAAKNGDIMAQWKRLPESIRYKEVVLYYLAKWQRQTRHAHMFAFWTTHRRHIKIDTFDWWKELQRTIYAGIHLGKHDEINSIIHAYYPKENLGDRASSLWLRGWINLKNPDKTKRNPVRALKNFGEIYEFATFATTKSQAAYWAGLAAKEMGNAALGAQWFGKAAGYTTTYYGQLASDELNAVYDVKLRSWKNVDTAWLQKKNQVRTLCDFIQMLSRIDAGWEIYDCLVALLYRAENPSQALGVLSFCQKNYPPAFVFVSRVAMSRFGVEMRGYFPLLPPFYFKQEVDPALVHAVIHRESSFLHSAVSPAGAIGLMQLMPATAKEVSKAIGIRFMHNDELKKPHVNMQVGQRYLATLLAKYDGCIPLALAAYNAGPHNAQKWIDALGNPCKNTDINSWIEAIPFTETRHYVKAVLTNYRIYQLLLEPNNDPQT
ncbi:MAG: transglycosylase SLT domain-containing protein [Alphaproteobacteria bacterium]|nr:MAG: transglycosylase SLT domain-containing protein [Alphaproteobacteria bacterium]